MTEVLKNLYKVNSRNIFLLWRNFAASIAVIVATILLTKFLPTFCAPIISTAACGVLYFLVYSHAVSDTETCVVVPYAVFLVLLTYTFALVTLNLANVWGLINLYSAIVFFDGFFVPALLLGPCGTVVCSLLYLRRHKLSICSDCKLTNGQTIERGQRGVIFSQESELQLRNLIFVFALVGGIGWIYFLFFFSDVCLTDRDSYVFTGISLTIYIGDAIIFGLRYYNLYLDLKERDELVSPAELQNISTRTYLRYYVICGDSIYLTRRHIDDMRDDMSEVLDTPFFTRKIVNGIPESEVKSMIEKATGVKGGTLKFFYGRKINDSGKHRIMRYFYFLPGQPSDYPELRVSGEWLSSEKFKTIYNTTPIRMASSLLADISRLGTIIVTSKIYDISGERRNKLMHYRPSFSFQELLNSSLDFHSDTWIKVSQYNSDHRFYKIKKFLRKGAKDDRNHFPIQPLE